MFPVFDLPTLWAFVIAFAVFAYVGMDGFDLGIGILFPFLPPGPQRDAAMNSVAPVWDGNETWLVLGGGGLMAAFPLAYAIVLPALYAPIIAMLLALIFRGVAFEFRWRDPAHRAFWDVAFTSGPGGGAFAPGGGRRAPPGRPRPARLLGRGLPQRLGRRNFRPGRGPWGAAAGDRRRRPRLRR